MIFANLYFAALSDFLNSRPIPSSWQALFEARDREGIDRIQCALAGMNAHINHDLSLALLQIDDELHKGFSENTPQHQDYEHVNDLLETVLPTALKFLATGIVGEVVQDAGKVGKMLAVWNIRVARDLAWDFAEHLRQIPGFARDIALKSQTSLPEPWAALCSFQFSNLSSNGSIKTFITLCQIIHLPIFFLRLTLRHTARLLWEGI